MAEEAADEIARAVRRAEAGDASATGALFTALYDELHRLAEAQLRKSGGTVTMSATTLLHDAYVDLAGRASVSFPDQKRFFGYAARAMRGLIVDYVRRRKAQKRGGELTFMTLDDQDVAQEPESVDLERLAEALDALATSDAALAELVDLKFFCGLSLAEIAGLRQVSERTVQRDWAKARAVLHDSLHNA